MDSLDGEGGGVADCAHLSGAGGDGVYLCANGGTCLM